MRVETVDMSESTRRLEEGIYDPVEFEAALAWAQRQLPRGRGPQPARQGEEPRGAGRATGRSSSGWRSSHGTCWSATRGSRSSGFGEEAMGRNAILGGFQGQRQWTDHSPNGDFMEAILNSSFDWNGIRAPHIFATENDSLNGATMLLMYLLTNRAQIFADVRTYWSPEAVERVTGHRPEGLAADGFIHLINSGAATLDATGAMTDADGTPAMKPFWEIDDDDVAAALAATTWYPANRGYFRGGGFSSQFVSRGGMPVTMARINLVSGDGAGAPDRRRLDRRAARGGPRRPRPADRSHLADALVRAPDQRRTVRSGTSTRSWPTGPPTTARSATATSVRT